METTFSSDITGNRLLFKVSRAQLSFTLAGSSGKCPHILMVVPTCGRRRYVLGAITSVGTTKCSCIMVGSNSRSKALELYQRRSIGVLSLPRGLNVNKTIRTKRGCTREFNCSVSVRISNSNRRSPSCVPRLIGLVRNKTDLTVNSQFLIRASNFRSAFVHHIKVE